MLLFVSSVNLAWGDDVVVYIRSDGVVEPSGVSISVDESTYTLTGNISGSIVTTFVLVALMTFVIVYKLQQMLIF
jgi:hypothetical protein